MSHVIDYTSLLFEKRSYIYGEETCSPLFFSPFRSSQNNNKNLLSPYSYVEGPSSNSFFFWGGGGGGNCSSGEIAPVALYPLYVRGHAHVPRHVSRSYLSSYISMSNKISL